MIQILVDGLQLNIENIKKYDGRQKIKFVSYVIIFILTITLIILFQKLSEVKLNEFLDYTSGYEFSLNDGRVNEEVNIDDFNLNMFNGSIKLQGNGLSIDSIGLIDFDLFLGKAAQGDLYSLLMTNRGPLLVILFLTLYLKSFIFILVSFLAIVLLRNLLFKTSNFNIINKSASFEMVSSLITLPGASYLVLMVLGFNNSISLFLFISIYVIEVFYLSRSEEK